MDQGEPFRHSHLFTVRLWLEELGAGQTEWRGEVHYVVDGERQYFRDWPALVAALQAMLARTGGVDENQLNMRT